MSGAPPGPLRIQVHYDFASALCYVAHRVIGRLAQDLQDLEIALDWSPLDLATLLGIERGGGVSALRRSNAERVARELGVSCRVPERWPDSRLANALALAAEARDLGPTWRERVFSHVHESGRELDADDAVLELARLAGLDLAPDEIENHMTALAEHTRDAAQAQVTGVPTFMLGGWPLGGIQTEDTMRTLFRRYATRQRQGSSS